MSLSDADMELAKPLSPAWVPVAGHEGFLEGLHSWMAVLGWSHGGSMLVTVDHSPSFAQEGQQ